MPDALNLLEAKRTDAREEIHVLFVLKPDFIFYKSMAYVNVGFCVHIVFLFHHYSECVCVRALVSVNKNQHAGTSEQKHDDELFSTEYRLSCSSCFFCECVWIFEKAKNKFGRIMCHIQC